MAPTANKSTKQKLEDRKKKEKTIAWEAPEFEYVEKSKDWFWIVGSVGVCISLGAFIISNWSFGILVIISTIMFMFLSLKRPAVVQVLLNKKNITINGNSYHLKNYQSFNIDPERNKLLFKSTNRYAPLMVVPLPAQSPSDKIMDILEDERGMEQDEDLHEPFLEIIMHRLGF